MTKIVAIYRGNPGVVAAAATLVDQCKPGDAGA
jgi:hypothetical protein